MSTVIEIQEAIEKLSPRDKAALSAWLRSMEEPVMSNREQEALLASLDKAARELDAGQGVPIEEVRNRAGKRATR